MLDMTDGASWEHKRSRTCISRVAASKADTPSALVFDGVATAGTAAAAAAAAAAADDADGVDDAAAGTLSPLCVTDVRLPSLLAPLPTVPG
jgi:hypothetical protein